MNIRHVDNISPPSRHLRSLVRTATRLFSLPQEDLAVLLDEAQSQVYTCQHALEQAQSNLQAATATLTALEKLRHLSR